MRPESEFTPPSVWCPRPACWHAADAHAAEGEVVALLSGLCRAAQPDWVIETGSYMGQVTAALGRALRDNGHGHLFAIELDAVKAAETVEATNKLPVSVIYGSAVDWLSHPGRVFAAPGVGLAFLDAAIEDRPRELYALAPHLAPGAVVVIHDTAPHQGMAPLLGDVLHSMDMQAVTLRTPRGVTIAQRRRDG